MKQLQMVTQGLPPIRSANTFGAFPYEGLGAQLNHTVQWREVTDVQRSMEAQEKMSLGLPRWSGRASSMQARP